MRQAKGKGGSEGTGEKLEDVLRLGCMDLSVYGFRVKAWARIIVIGLCISNGKALDKRHKIYHATKQRNSF